MGIALIIIGSILFAWWLFGLWKYIGMTEKRMLKKYKKKQLRVEICPEEVTVFLPDGREVVHWVYTEWEEDPTITPAIIHAVIMAYEDPDALIRINKYHIESQENFNG